MIELKRCPICGKEPKVIRDWAYETNGYGAWCTIQCKPFMRKPNLKIVEGKSTWDRALRYGLNVGIALPIGSRKTMIYRNDISTKEYYS